MKKSVSLKLLIFSFLLVASAAYSAPAFQAGTESDSTVAGGANTATGVASSAFGFKNKANGMGSSAFGYENKTSENYGSAFGISNEASKEQSSAFGIFNTASGIASSAVGAQNTASGDGGSAIGYNNKATGKFSSTVGTLTYTSGDESATFGVGAWDKSLNGGKGDFVYKNEGKYSFSIGRYNNIAAGTENNHILGNNSEISASNSVAIGTKNKISGNFSTAVGYNNNVSGNHSGAFGDPNVVTGNHSYAFGNNNTINGDNNFVLGNNVTIGAGIQNSVALGNNSTVSSSNEVSVGSKGKERKITNVADGEVSATSTDAVTGKQLYKAMQNSGATGIENLRNEVYEKIDDVKDEVRGVGSLSAALAGLHPMQYDPKAPTQVMAALGQYKNKQSVAVGLSYYFNDRFMMSTGIALSGEKKTKTMANVGFTLKLGKGSGVSYNETPQYVVQNEVKRLTVENQDLKTKLNNQENKIEVQDNKIKEQDEKIKNLEEKLNRLLKTK